MTFDTRKRRKRHLQRKVKETLKKRICKLDHRNSWEHELAQAVKIIGTHEDVEMTNPWNNPAITINKWKLEHDWQTNTVDIVADIVERKPTKSY